MRQTLRTPATQGKYDDSMCVARKQGYRRCYLCAARIIKEFAGWKIVDNEYPYDRIADTHHMVTLKRHAPATDMTSYEKMEYERDVKEYLHKHYDLIFENTIRTKSIPGHHHIHMITLKKPHQHRRRVADTTMAIPLETVHR